MLPRFLLFCLLAGLTAPAYAQMPGNPDAARMDRLERDLMVLQRQLARGESLPTPVSGGASPDITGPGAASLEVRMIQLEEQMRALRGKVEETEFRVSQITDRFDKYQKDVDFRLNQQTPATPQTAAPAPVEPPKKQPPGNPKSLVPDDGIIPATPQDADDPDSAEDLPPTPQPKPAAQPAPAVPSGETSAGDGALKLPDKKSGANARDQYNQAFKLLNQTKYDEAATSFQDFIARNPKDPLVGNAYYWLGETHYIHRDYVKAADTFRQGFEVLPGGPKAADNLLKLSMSLSAMKKQKEACIVLDQILAKFSKSSQTVMQKAEQERTRVGCE